MAATKVHGPGTDYGPYMGACTHRDCAASREQAAAVCDICGVPIGYETYWFTVRSTLPNGGEVESAVHEACLVEANARGR